MIKTHWVFVGFAAGILVGVWGAREFADAPPPAAQSGAAPDAVALAQPGSGQSSLPMAAARPASPAAARPGPTNPAAAPAPGDFPEPPQTPGLADLPAGRAAPSPFEPSVDSGTVQPIDVGEMFAKQIARPSRPGEENQIGEAHRALEREARDDQWAYTMEGELQNSMVTQTSTGAFKLEHMECRATICEVRISGRADQQAALREWSDSLVHSGLKQRLFPNMSSSMSTDERVDALYIFRRPKKP